MVKESDILEKVGQVTILGSRDDFVVKDKFIIEKSEKAAIIINCIGSNFAKWFLPKVERSVGDIIAEQLIFLGSFNDRKILDLSVGDIMLNVGHIYSLLEKQGRQQAGSLLTDGRLNIFYALDKDGIKRAIRMRWYMGWIIVANETDGMTVYGKKSQLFRRLAA